MIIKPGPNVTPYKPAVKPPTKPVGNPTEKPVGVAVTPPKATAPSNPYGLDPAVYSAVSPQLTYLDQVQAQNQAALEGLTKAIMSQLGGMSGQIGDQYNQGIQQQQALAQAGSDSLRQANPNASVQSLLGAIGAPASQGDQIANNLANTFGGGAAATFGRQGVLPVTRLIGDKLLQQNFASELPGIQGVAATNALKNLLASSNNEKLKVLAQVPQIQSDLAKSKMDQQKFALDQQKAASDLFFKNANLGLAKRKDAYNEWLGQKKLGLASQNQSFSQWAKTQGLKIQGQRVNIAQQNANTSAARAAQSYDVQLQRLGISQAHLSLDQQKFVEQARKNEAKAKRGNFTPSQMARFRGAANRIAANSFKGIEDPKNPGKFLAPPLKDDPNGFQKAVLEMFQSKAGAIPLTVALKALNRYWKVPGQGGRPYQELPLRQRLKGKAEAAQGAAYQPTAYTGKLSSTQLPQLAQQALAIAAPKYANNANVQALVGRIMQESGGNPAAINLWDSNAKSGHPSKGILQTIDSTFNAYALPGHTDIWNPLDNAIAAVRYMLARYGHIVGPSGTGY